MGGPLKPSKPANRLHDPVWVREALDELMDDHGKFPEEITMTEARYMEIKGVLYNDPTLMPGPPPPDSGAVSVGSIIRDCNTAASRMSNTNPNKKIVLTAAHALNQLVTRLDVYEGGKGVN